MTRRGLIVGLAGIGFACTAIISPRPAVAHHSFAAEFDRDQPIEITGRVTLVEWTNPHARFYVDAEDENGELVNWNFELTTPNILTRRGWSRNSLKEGDVVTVTGFQARNSPHLGNASRVTLASGEALFTGSAPD